MTRPPGRGSFWRLSLRARLMTIGVLGVAGSLLIGGVLLYVAFGWAVNRTLDGQADATASQVADLVDDNRLPAVVPAPGTQIVQVVDAQDRVLAGSVTADRLTPLLQPDELRRALAGQAVMVSGSRAALTSPLRVHATLAKATTGSSVLVATPMGDVLATRSVLRSALLLGFPLILIVLGAIAWRAIGWTLRPVEQLREGAERISGAGRTERLPVPHAADEIRALALTLNGMLDRLDTARARQRSFVADAAHELRSPLATIRAQLEVAQHLGEGGSLPRELMVDVDRLSRLVEDLLLLARSDAPAPAKLAVVSVRGLVRGVSASYRHARVPVEVGPIAARTVLADPDELRRALTNLVDNAVRHAASRVRVRAEDSDGRVVLRVEDDGPGVPPAERERVFDRFTRLDDARERSSGGSGLGLAITRELIKRSGGTVRLADAEPPWSLAAEIRLESAEPDRVEDPSEPAPVLRASSRTAPTAPQGRS